MGRRGSVVRPSAAGHPSLCLPHDPLTFPLPLCGACILYLLGPQNFESLYCFTLHSQSAGESCWHSLQKALSARLPFIPAPPGTKPPGPS